ncbi:MAG: response regulator [Mariprofundaceae bacterium]
MKPLILLLDDDTDFRASMRAALERRDLACMEAEHAEDAMQLIDQVRFTHAILDLNLGTGDSGLVVLRYLTAAQPECRALILTGYASIATAVEATKSGAVQYLPKPATIDEILAAFEETAPAVDPPPGEPPSPKRLEWEYIQRALLRNHGNISATARELGMHRRTLQRKLAKRPPRR